MGQKTSASVRDFLPGFASLDIDTAPGVTIHDRQGGSGPPVLLPFLRGGNGSRKADRGWSWNYTLILRQSSAVIASEANQSRRA
jgi:hypothetical protein